MKAGKKISPQRARRTQRRKASRGEKDNAGPREEKDGER
jgi:hypothetical protein